MSIFNPKYDDNKTENTIYMGEVKSNGGKNYRMAEMLFYAGEMPLESENETDEQVETKVINDLVLYKTKGGQQKVQCWVEQYDGFSYTKGLRIARRTSKGVYGSQEICLNFESALKLRRFLNCIFAEDYSNTARHKINIDEIEDDKSLPAIKLSIKEFENLISYNIENIDNYETLVALKKRQQAIDRLMEIIDNPNSYTNEIEINHLLKNNLWMFNNDYVFFSQNDHINKANILDLVPVTYDGFIDIIELKLPTVKILHWDNSHNNHYPSADLTKAIAQCINYIHEVEDLAHEHESYLKPRATIIIGNTTELSKEESNCLRLLNASLHNIRIYTYQQLLQKAKNSLDFLKKTTL